MRGSLKGVMTRSGTIRISLPVAFVLLSTVIAVPATGNDDSLTLEEAFDLPLEELATIQIATGTPRPIAEAPAIATVVTAEEIRALGATDLDRVLESVPGLHVGYHHDSYYPLYMMRGLYSDTSPYVLFLVDGLPINQWTSGNVGSFWGGLPVADVARVEVLRGPGSALFGADAVGGVVNIITKDAADLAGTEVGARAGSFDTRDAWLLHGGEHGGYELALSLQLHTTDGHGEVVAADAQTGFDRFFGTDASLAPGPVRTDRDRIDAKVDVGRGGWRLRLGFQGRFDLGTGGGTIQALDPTGSKERRRHTADLLWRRDDLVPGWQIEARASYLRDRTDAAIRALPPGAATGTTILPDGTRVAFGQTERHLRIETAGTYTGFRHHRLRLGAGYRGLRIGDIHLERTTDLSGGLLPGGFQDVSDDPDLVYALPQERTERFLFVQDEWRLGRRWDLTAGVRWDRYSDFGDTVNPRLALVWRATDRLTAKILYGRAFRPPSFREQYLINNTEFIGNPELDPEVIQTGEVGLAYRHPSGTAFGINFFRYRLRDLILPVGPPPAAYRNVGERDGFGFELEAEGAPADGWWLEGSYAYQRSEDVDSGADAGHAPHHQLHLRAERHLRSWRLSLVATAVADRERVAGDPRPPVDDYATVDLIVRRKKLPGKLEATLLARNLFDATVLEPSFYVPGPLPRYIPGDLPLAGRSFLVELRWRR